MSLNSRLLVSLSLTLALFSSSSAVGLDTPDERWLWDKSQKESFGIVFQESSELIAQPNQLSGTEEISSATKGALKCLSVVDPSCKDVTKFIYFFYLPSCEEVSSINCIEGLWAIDNSGKRIEGLRFGEISSFLLPPYTNKGAPSLPTGSVPQIFRIPGVIHSGGSDLYSVNAQVKGGDRGKNELGEWTFGQEGIFETGIYPITITEGEYGETGLFNNKIENRFCAHAGGGQCSMRESFPDGVRFGLKVRLGWRANGWIHGRIGEPIAAFDSTQSGATYRSVISVEAEPVQVPTFSVTMPKAQLPTDLKRLYLEGGAESDPRIWGRGGIGTSIGNAVNGEAINSFVYEPNVANGIEELAMWLPLGQEKATVAPKYWSFKLRSAWDKCTKENSKLSAILGTNATTYMDGPPVFNEKTQTLDYQVSAPHLMPDGNKTLGRYDLVIDAEVARCIYGFSDAPVSASITVIGENGENRVAAITVNERNGQIFLSASGFTFSSPTLRVKLTQDARAANEVKTVEKKSILCVKGKVIKKVTGKRPKCPKGFKKR